MTKVEIFNHVYIKNGGICIEIKGKVVMIVKRIVMHKGGMTETVCN